jgi:sulfur-oxidizing protein SoxZ
MEIKTLAQHPMETGFRRTQTGELIPRDLIRTFRCTYNGVEVYRVDLHPAIAANPLIAFTTVATETGTLSFQWVGDNGYTVTETAAIRVE